MKIVHVITSLRDGGAEAVLYRLCKHDIHNKHTVVSLSDMGKYGNMLSEIGVTVHTLNMSPHWPSPCAFVRLVNLFRDEKPEVVQTWMYHSDLFGGLAARAAGIRSVVWSIHHTNLVPGESKKATIWIAKILSKISWWLPKKIIVCAQRAIDIHTELGYDKNKMVFVPNGYDLKSFAAGLDPENEIRSSFELDQNIPLLGTVGRFDPQKDHLNLLDALVVLNDRNISFHCILVGSGLDQSNSKLVAWIYERGLNKNVQLIGQRDDIPKIMNALDIHVLPSCSEAFPNVVCEAMACGTPCVVTDVGDASFIVGDTGWVVPPRNPKALATAIEAAIDGLSFNSARNMPSSRIRQRVEQNFSITQMCYNYSIVWKNSVLK